MDEINRIEYTNDRVPDEVFRNQENPSYRETGSYQETQSYDEFGRDTVHTPTEKERKKRKSSKSQAHLMSAAVVVAAVAVLAIVPSSIFSPIFEPFEEAFDGAFGGAIGGGSGGVGDDLSVDAEIYIDDVSDVGVSFTVTLTDASEEADYTVNLTNRFTNRPSHDITSDTSSFAEDGLKPGMDYTITVREDGDAIASATFTTAREDDTFFRLAYAECTCTDDGLFHIEVEVGDGDGTWTNIRAELTDLFGNTSTVAIDGSGSYAIQVTSAGLTGDTATLRIVCDGSDSPLYVGDVEI